MSQGRVDLGAVKRGPLESRIYREPNGSYTFDLTWNGELEYRSPHYPDQDTASFEADSARLEMFNLKVKGNKHGSQE